MKVRQTVTPALIKTYSQNSEFMMHNE